MPRLLARLVLLCLVMASASCCSKGTAHSVRGLNTPSESSAGDAIPTAGAVAQLTADLPPGIILNVGLPVIHTRRPITLDSVEARTSSPELRQVGAWGYRYTDVGGEIYGSYGDLTLERSFPRTPISATVLTPGVDVAPEFAIACQLIARMRGTYDVTGFDVDYHEAGGAHFRQRIIYDMKVSVFDFDIRREDGSIMSPAPA